MLTGDTTVVLSGLKRAHDGAATVVRLYESGGRQARTVLAGLPPGATVWEANVVEDRVRRLEPDDAGLALGFRPWQIRTLIVDDDIPGDHRP
jgi:alpha-mannosidase